jgi:hypothetical protein
LSAATGAALLQERERLALLGVSAPLGGDGKRLVKSAEVKFNQRV